MSGTNGDTPSASFANPHCVCVKVPRLGFGRDLDTMIQFYRERGEELRTGYCPTKTDQRDWIYFFVFRDPKNAEDFAERFSGESFYTPECR